MRAVPLHGEKPIGSSPGWRLWLGRRSAAENNLSEGFEKAEVPASKWSMGILNDRETNEVPGSVLLLTGHRNEPLGLQNAPARTSHSSFPASDPHRQHAVFENKKKTKDGAIILEPQPDDSQNDPLNWPSWRRDMALLSLGLYCMVGGGMTPILAAGYTNVAKTYNVSSSRVALTTGLYMMGLGVGSVVMSPTAILYGKRPVYLCGCIMGIACACWCAASPNFNSLLIARIFQGISISPVECLPSATIAEIFFLHERAYRLGIYTLLLLGGKNLIPLVSAAIIESYGWRWVFWIVAMIGGFCLMLLFLFVPETFWDRAPRPKIRRQTQTHGLFGGWKSSSKAMSSSVPDLTGLSAGDAPADERNLRKIAVSRSVVTAAAKSRKSSPASYKKYHVGFANQEQSVENDKSAASGETSCSRSKLRRRSVSNPTEISDGHHGDTSNVSSSSLKQKPLRSSASPTRHDTEARNAPKGGMPSSSDLDDSNSTYAGRQQSNFDILDRGRPTHNFADNGRETSPDICPPERPVPTMPPDDGIPSLQQRPPPPPRYTTILRERPRQTFIQQLKPYNGRLHSDNWFRVAIRPFILFAYPAVLWSSIVYACSVGWLIVLSESVSDIYRSKDTYNFSALSTGLIYISPFIGGILGTAVAGKVSDIIVRAMTRRNGGLYEPEFRLVMAAPVAVTTVIGLMGFGWSAQVRDSWIVPTVFFGIISFGCSLGSTTSITFCVDSYRIYAGEALVTLNFSKNIFHGLVFSLFFPGWLSSDGSRSVFLALGGIQLGLLLLTIPMYIYGKRARMWTVRKNFMEKF